MKSLIKSSVLSLIATLPLTSCNQAKEPAPVAQIVLPTSAAPNPVAITVVDEAPVVRQRYEDWKQAWCDMNIDSFMSFYSPKVIAGKSTNFQGIIELKTRQWAKERIIQITDVSTRRISVRGKEATVSAVQVYDSTTWWDKGVKTLKLEKSNGQWLIIRETFKAYAERAKRPATPTPTPGAVVDSSPIEVPPPSALAIQPAPQSEPLNIGSPGFDTPPSVDASGSSAVRQTNSGCSSGATAICSDGSLSFSAHRRGTCSHHGGVSTWCG